MEQTDTAVRVGRHGPLTDDERRDIYRRYFIAKESMDVIRSAISCTRVTVSRCLHAQQRVLASLRADLGRGRPRRGIHYARYLEQVISATTMHPRQRRREEKTDFAEHFIAEWWHHQQREAQSKRWMDAAKLYQRYCAVLTASETPVSYRTFTRAMKRLIGEAYDTPRGRPIPRRRGRPKGTHTK